MALEGFDRSMGGGAVTEWRDCLAFSGSISPIESPLHLTVGKVNSNGQSRD